MFKMINIVQTCNPISSKTHAFLHPPVLGTTPNGIQLKYKCPLNWIRHVPPFIKRAGEGKGETRETRTRSPHWMFLIHVGFFSSSRTIQARAAPNVRVGSITTHPIELPFKHAPQTLAQSRFPGAPAHTRPLHTRLLICKFRALFLKLSLVAF